MHSIKYAARTGQIPGSHYTFKDEDFVGTKKKVATKCWKEAGSAVIEREQYYWALKLHNANVKELEVAKKEMEMHMKIKKRDTYP